MIPKDAMEDFIGAGMWVGHEFDCKGRNMVVASIGQLTMENGKAVVPLGVQEIHCEAEPFEAAINETTNEG